MDTTSLQKKKDGGLADEKPSSHANVPPDNEYAENSHPVSTLGSSSLYPSFTNSGFSDTLAPYVDLRETHEEAFEETLLPLHSRHPPAMQNIFTAPIIRAFHAFGKSLRPQPPRPHTIRPVFRQLQIAPILYLHKATSKKTQFWLLVGFYLVWGLLFLGALSSSVFGCQVAGYGSPVRLSCVSRFWPGSITCGVNGENCRPFHHRTFAFRCPATCQATIISTPETIGGREINYQNVVVGGSMQLNHAKVPTYRGDSFICAAAIHAGLLDGRYGGSGIVSLIGEQKNFPSVESNGISSIEFGPSFPVAFSFPEGGENTEIKTSCKDPRWVVLAISVICTSLLSIFTVSPAVFFGSVFVGVYLTVALALDSPDFEDYYSVISQAFGGLLPAVFVGLVIYYFCVSHTLRNLTAQFERTVLWLGACWMGALDNFTLERLPIQRLTPHDLQQPGALNTLIVIVVLIVAIALSQAWAFSTEGRMLRYLTFYALLGVFLLTLTTIPHMNLRLHHYVIALILLPGTALQTRPSLIYQGFLVGLFLNGIARWGFDSILQTPGELFGDELNSIVPQITTPIIDGNNITFLWANLTSAFDSISVLVNDVERFRGYADHTSGSFSWTRYKADEPEFFRFGYIRYPKMGGSIIGDYTQPATWATNGTWFP